jgi:hypothetical protein
VERRGRHPTLFILPAHRLEVCTSTEINDLEICILNVETNAPGSFYIFQNSQNGIIHAFEQAEVFEATVQNFADKLYS